MMRFGGSIKFWNADRGYGFATRDDGNGDVFLHIRELRDREIDALPQGTRVEFEIGPNARTGKTEAHDVIMINGSS